MNERETGIVLKQSDYRERDVLLSVYTKTYGKISFVVPGARKITSKNAASILPYEETELLFDAKEGKSLFRLRNAHVLQLFRHLRMDLSSVAAAGVISEVMDAMTLPRDTHDSEKLYDTLSASFSALDTGVHPDTVLAVYLGDILTRFGFRPAVDGCVLCGSDTVCALSAAEGGFLCEKHAEEKQIPQQDRVALARFRMLVRAGMQHLSYVIDKGGAKQCDVDVLVDMLERYASVHIKTYTFYTKVRGD